MKPTVYILKGSGRLKPFLQEIRNVANNAIRLASRGIPVKNTDIVIYDNPRGVIPKEGVGGFATYSGMIIFISMNPEFSPFEKAIHENLPRHIIHELHHVARIQKIGYGDTLRKTLITEGLACRFEIEITHKSPPPWCTALNDNQIQKFLVRAQKEFDSTSYDHSKWFFGKGDKTIPYWTGYTLGFTIVGEYLKKHPKESAASLYALPANNFFS